MKSVRRFVFWSILCCIAVFVVTAAMPVSAANVPAARLEGDAIEPEVVETPETPVYELPKMDFVPAQVEEPARPVVSKPAPVIVREEPPVVQTQPGADAGDRSLESGRTVRNRKISGRIRDYWLKIHADSDGAAVEKSDVVTTVSPNAKVITAPASVARQEPAVAAAEPVSEGAIIRQVPVEKTPAVVNAEPVAERPRPALEDAKPAEEAVEETTTAAEETKSVAEIPEKNVETASAAGPRKLSSRVRDYWLKIHAQDEEVQVAAKAPTTRMTPQPTKPLIVRRQPREEKTEKPVAVVEKPAAEPKVEIAVATPAETPDSKEGTFAPAPTVTSPPLTEAPVVFQKKSAKLALFSAPLAKMAQRREYRLAEAKRLNIVLPSQGGSFDKLPQSIARLKTAVEDILTRNGAGMVLSMIFKGHFAGGSTNQKRTNR